MPHKRLKYSFGLGRDLGRDQAWSDYVLSARVDRKGKLGDALRYHLAVRTAVYAIGPKSGTPLKIGFSRRLTTRLIGLQTSSPEELRFHLVCWVATKAEATKLESRCHKILTETGRHIRGEWFNLTPLEAAKVIDHASIDVNCTIVPHKYLVKRFQSSDDPLAGYFWSGVPGEQEAA